jgi:RNA-directed DNA polymerase
VRLTIEPIFEREFMPQSYGFRPGRGCKDALREVDRLLKSGHIQIVDADIKAYFDSISHELLMKEVRKYIADGAVLKLLEKFLKAEILDSMRRWSPDTGTPQGAVISPLLANLFLHSVDYSLAQAGYQMVRYADDLVILCQNPGQAQEALETLKGLLDAKGLELHPDKTKVVDLTVVGEGFEFLGYRFSLKGRWPRKKSLMKLRESIREKTGRCNGNSLEVIIEDVNKTLRGWFEYFKHSNKWTFPSIDGWVRRRIRSILRKRKGLGGISRGRDHNQWKNSFFHERGLFCLEHAHRLAIQSSKR